MCRVSQAFLLKAIAAGALPAYRAGRSYRIRGTDARGFALGVGVEPPEDEFLAHQTHQTHQTHGAK